MMNFDAVTGAIGKAVKFFDEKILPKAKVFYEDMKETTIGVFDGLFEKDKGLFPLIGKGLKDIADICFGLDDQKASKAEPKCWYPRWHH